MFPPCGHLKHSQHGRMSPVSLFERTLRNPSSVLPMEVGPTSKNGSQLRIPEWKPNWQPTADTRGVTKKKHASASISGMPSNKPTRNKQSPCQTPLHPQGMLGSSGTSTIPRSNKMHDSRMFDLHAESPASNLGLFLQRRGRAFRTLPYVCRFTSGSFMAREESMRPQSEKKRLMVN